MRNLPNVSYDLDVMDMFLKRLEYLNISVLREMQI
jgi:hypothetical protein